MPVGTLDLIDHVREDVTNGRADQRKNDDYDYSNQHKNERVFNQTLAFFFRGEQHVFHLLSVAVF
jgi:hypothetical protein